MLARAHHDFSDEDLRVAAAVQPLLALVDRQVSALGGRPPASGPDLTAGSWPSSACSPRA